MRLWGRPLHRHRTHNDVGLFQKIVKMIGLRSAAYTASDRVQDGASGFRYANPCLGAQADEDVPSNPWVIDSTSEFLHREW
jgi:hypothetical protein